MTRRRILVLIAITTVLLACATVWPWFFRPKGQVLCFDGHLTNIVAFATLPGDKYIVSGDLWGRTLLWDARSGKVAKTLFEGYRRVQGLGGLTASSGIQDISVTAAGEIIVVYGYALVCTYDSRTGGMLRSFRIPSEENLSGLVALSSDGKWALAYHYGGIGNSGKILWLWDVEHQAQVRRFELPGAGQPNVGGPGYESPPGGMVIASNGKKAAVAWTEDTIYVWDVGSGRIDSQLKGHMGSVTTLAISSNGEIILAGGSDGTVRWWNSGTGHQAVPLLAHRGGVETVAISPNDRVGMSGGMDNNVRLWDLQGARELFCFEGHESPVFRVAFSRDGRWAISGAGGQRCGSCTAEDTSIRMWDLTSFGSEEEKDKRTGTGNPHPIQKSFK